MKTLSQFRQLRHCKVLLSHCLVPSHFVWEVLCMRGGSKKVWFTIFRFPSIHIVTQYNPSVPNLKHILMEKWHLIESQPKLFARVTVKT